MRRTRLALCAAALPALWLAACEPEERFLVGSAEDAGAPRVPTRDLPGTEIDRPIAPPGEPPRPMPPRDVGPQPPSRDGGVRGVDARVGTEPPLLPIEPMTCSPAQMPIRPLAISATDAVDRVSRFLYGKRADAALLRQAATLRTSADVGNLARALLRDDPVPEGVRTFFERWLELEALPDTSPPAELEKLVTPALRDSMAQETDRFIVDTMRDGSLSTMLTATTAWVDDRLASIYGLKEVGGPNGATFRRTSLDPQQRAGLLTQPTWLLLNPTPTVRGAWIREKLLCQPTPAPPEDNTLPEPAKPGLTYRQRLEQATASEGCQGCHQLMDQPGFAFEHLDGIGRFRPVDGVQQVDTRGRLVHVAEPFGFDRAPQLMGGLAKSCEVQVCLARSWLEHALGGELRPDDMPSVAEISAAFAAGRHQMRELVAAVVQSQAFLAR